MKLERLTIPSVLAVVALGGAATFAAVSCGDDAEPQECMVEGVCPSDGKVCVSQQTGELCCPICPINNQCSTGCLLEFPPV